MNRMIAFACLGLALASAAPATAQADRAQSNKGQGKDVQMCDDRAQAQQDELCIWLRMIANGDQYIWIENHKEDQAR